MHPPTSFPTRVGVFPSVDQADEAVRRLLSAGFDEEELGVICSQNCSVKSLRRVPHPDMPPGTPPAAGKTIPAGAAIGATIGGLALAATSLVSGGIPLLAAGTVLVAGGAVAGAFSGAMATVGYDAEAAEKCDEALREGKILVFAEDQETEQETRLARAEQILREAGADEVLKIAA